METEICRSSRQRYRHTSMLTGRQAYIETDTQADRQAGIDTG